jgi:hypothetical protein
MLQIFIKIFTKNTLKSEFKKILSGFLELVGAFNIN